jgi:hypothetical protein
MVNSGPEEKGEFLMLPEVKEYYDTAQGGNEWYRTEERVQNENPVPMWRESFSAEERATYYAAEEKRSLAVVKAHNEIRERHALAREALRNSDNKVVKWLMTDRVLQRDYTGYRDEVLKALPMDRAEIDEFGDRKGWCGDYARMLERAERAGVLPDPTPELADVSELASYIRNNYGGSRVTITRAILRHLPAILESAAQRKAEQEAAEKAKAETPVVDSTPADVQPRPRVHRNADGTFAPALAVSA